MIASLLRIRLSCVVIIDLALIGLANYLAFWLRFDGIVPDWAMGLFEQTLPLLMVVRLASFLTFRLYQGVWKHTGIWDLGNIIAASICGMAVFHLIVRWGIGLMVYPQSIYLLDTVLVIVLVGGARLCRRYLHERARSKGEIRVVVYGAGSAGERLVRALKQNSVNKYKPVGFLDDDPSKMGKRIHGVPVLGSRQQLAKIMAEIAPQVVLLAIPTAKPKVMRDLVQLFEPHKVRIQTVPNLQSILDGLVEITQIRNLAIEDLLERTPVGLDVTSLRQLIKGKTIMVTGAGGSIGSELCRQIAVLEPSLLVLFERYENSLFAIHNELVDRACGISVCPVVGDVGDEAQVEKILQSFKPAIVFHAAAHKHVPLMEASPCEAVKNNVRGTRIAAQASARCGVEQFIMISTDKAVNPTSVMGVTKRVAELIVQSLEECGQTRFSIVRFGNVLGSNGSVVPRFLEQIKAGGPVTVTHPEIRRYFMMIPEAVQLVLHAAVMGEPGAIYVLDMGDQIRIVDLARQLIRLTGLVPEEDIAISFVGLRPGEKLYEELVGHAELIEPSRLEKIAKVRSNSPWTLYTLRSRIAILEQAAARQEADLVIELLRELVPTFKPTGDMVIAEAERGLSDTDLSQMSVGSRTLQ
ncbi:Polysaccharide biosynthesis protein CapD [Candidatus Nitrospira nitrosa]|uniref:Polysaccharide biosynthesis protein CapD n=1 Tax=Candidatus Nitrospira nitrosa TaxID=1742972 RepID=A0A0S4L7H6_9BACT|nr:nucleoside-diphosphate sugar epimerase/dehydratase [Candidatus Nitrospira nitrosa]CUS32560.1 Polysaccharide biosynthesis protein CapD [Candidatus Nitrospira nitrosa]